ncbi:MULTISPECIES: cation:proton antiporter [Gammaproteobacteria]|mgnify:FL=1|jgi:Kef-type K+ transport system membrane component KefB|uniref:Cation:proton antiporter n=1 Tax=Vreelandella halophila TaxID=86177 RepID=A0A9X4YD67_9GAMM|nr:MULTISPECIES: cation:proton antiporter [Gammaproteobacteria]KAA8983395.1 cation:proton antiporter [Halospina sp. K52047b]MYL27108.1 cation:proton antiporter [Halomonas utahensis]MYL74310.1 cation:proton antiporter [Halomonas sp. 22501_18_FS]
MTDPGTTVTHLIVIGLLLSVSVLADAIATRTRLPRISLLVLIGVLVAAVQQGILGYAEARPLGELSEPLITLALVMVAFLLGGELTLDRLRATGPAILVISLSVIGVGAVAVAAGLLGVGYPLAVAFSLAAISVATDPAAVSEAIRETGKDDTQSRVIRGIVAIDDAWGIIVFGLVMAGLGFLVSGDGAGALLEAGWELGGAVLVGVGLGLPAAWLTGRLRPGEPTQSEALALVFLIAGLSEYLHLSSLLTAMVAGFVIVNVTHHHTRSFTEIEHIEWPFLVFFFVLSGASVDFAYLGSAGGLILTYIGLRVLGRYVGGRLGVTLLGHRGRDLSPGIGLALTPQAGVAMGMALLAAERHPEHGSLIVATVVTSTIAFELLGPLLVRRVLSRAG